MKTKTKEIRKQIINSLSKIQVTMMNSLGGDGITYKDEMLVEREANLIIKALSSSRREMINEIITIATLAFGKDHINYEEFIKGINLLILKKKE